MISPLVCRFIARPTLPLVLFAAVGLGAGCSASGTNSATGSGGGNGNPGTGGKTNSTGSGGSNGNPGSGGNGNPNSGTGGSGNPGTGGSGNLGSGGSGNSGSGGNGNPGTGGRGNPGTGGSGAPGSGGNGGPGTGGSGGPGTGGAMQPGTPPGYWSYAPKMWSGCSWTGIDVVAGTTTTNTPKDFVSKAPADPYCVSGTVNANNDSVALLGFNLAEPAAGANCAYNPTLIKTLPGVTLTGTGIAVAFSKKISTDMRIQVQGPNGATDANDRWCAKITEPAGPVFVPYTSFNSKCWDNSGAAFTPSAKMIAAVSFLVAGGAAATPFNYCIGGFSTGTSVADAPAYSGMTGPVTGTIGGPGGMPIDYQRVKVSAGGKSYIVQNNNWGNWQGTDQTLTYTDNSFKITSPTGASPDGMKPASFPSIYIGANGDTQMGTYSTHLNNGMANQPGDNLPKQVSSIQSVKSTFRYNTAGGDYNATYDIWFASGLPTSAYDDGISGFVMIWLYKPGNRSPIGSVMRSNVTIPGAPGMWDVWVGPRGTAPNPSRPVVSYVAKATLMAFTNVDLKPFMTDAATNGIMSSWYLTDVFAGFEIWSGGGTQNLQLQEFTAVVQ